MILISHRGNLIGKNPSAENSRECILLALNEGFDVEIDLWFTDGKLWLGHDRPNYPVGIDFLTKHSDRLWLHCKSLETLAYLSNYDTYNYFFHDSDLATITSKGYLWVYPGNQPVKNSIAVLPEINNDDVSEAVGVCSDFIRHYALG